MQRTLSMAGTIVFLCLSFLVTFTSFFSCASQKPIQMKSSMSVLLENVSVEPIDQFSVKLSAFLVIANSHSSPHRVKSIHSVLTSGTCILYDNTATAMADVPAKASIRIPIYATLGVQKLLENDSFAEESALASYLLECEVFFGSNREDSILASSSGDIPLVREPLMNITEIKIVRDILVTTKLYLKIEIKNRNAFPLTFNSFTYKFFGEGRHWTAGKTEEPYEIPALAAKTITLPIEMNFTSMGRDVFDLVANLQRINYRLLGESDIFTGLPQLSAFIMKFSLSGDTEVRR